MKEKLHENGLTVDSGAEARTIRVSNYALDIWPEFVAYAKARRISLAKAARQLLELGLMDLEQTEGVRL